MSSLSDFSKKFTPRKREEKQTEEQNNIRNNNMQDKAKIENNVKEQYNKYSGMNQNQMMNELFKETNRLKQNGQFNYEALVKTIDSMSGVLSEEQKNKMKELLKQLR